MSARSVLGLVSVGLLVTASASAVPVEVIGGQTNVTLDTDLLASAAGLTLSSVSDDVIVPGTDPYAVAFGINPRDAMAPALPTTFAFDTDNFLGTFGGTVEHSGRVLFNSDTIEVGNFTVGFDLARAGTLGGAASGFFVQDTFSVGAILFDVENPSGLSATETELLIESNLLVSPEFAGFLIDQGLTSADLSGADVGDALVEAAVPEPGTVALALLGLVGFAARRRR